MKLNNTAGLIFIVSFLSMLGPFSIDTYLPSFPSIENEFLVSRDYLSRTIAFYMVATAISALFWGPLSDRLGRKPVIQLTLVLYTAASLGCAFAANYSDFLIARVFQGLAASGGLVIGRAMVRDVYDSRDAHRAMAYVLMLFALAPALAPIIGGWLHNAAGWRSIFYFLSFYSVVLLVASSLFLRETLTYEKRRSFHPLYVLRVYLQTILHIEFIMLVLALGVSFAGLFIYIAGSPTLMFEFLGLSSGDFALQFVPMTAGIIAGSFLSGKLSRRWSKRKIINVAFIIMGFAVSVNILQAVFMQPTLVPVVAPVVIYAFGVAMSMPAFGILAIDSFPGNKGAAAAVQSFVQIIFSALVAGVVLSFISESIIGFASGQMLMLVISALLWGVYCFLRNK
ncbi:Multidrug resistance transporter, Bcr/CflA family [hydrothermal vent metagenome]|uniref:Multidrug resistance transporter, Bcr/CflA family n=1 Tax=hydrothermal vent metagenome TaxID=652676 RepID=A0A3B0Y2S2_9ZZZZ